MSIIKEPFTPVSQRPKAYTSKTYDRVSPSRTDHSAQKPQEFSFNDNDFKRISERVLKMTGIVLKPEKKVLVYARLSKRLRALNLKSFSDYYALIDSARGAEELTSFTNAITTNLTRFFREPHHFEHIKNVLIPMWTKRYEKSPTPQNKKIRIWSAGCSSGEEPYSIAMTLAAHLPPMLDAEIIATDIDTNMLSTGKNRIYTSFQGIPPAYIKKFCKDNGKGGGEILEAVARKITFTRLNLIEDWPIKGPFQAVFCRNVVIYFSKETQMKLFDRIHSVIEPRGWLFIGHSESLFKVCDKFDSMGQTMYQKKAEPL